MDKEDFSDNFSRPDERKVPGWQYDETKLCGAKFEREEYVDGYDEHHQRFRDYKKEAEEGIEMLALDLQSTLIDMGCGTGAFAINAASRLGKIYAVDVSRAMLKCACKKAKEADIKNIEFYHGGFLTYKHRAEPVDAVVSTLVSHHLPDFWKLIALKRLTQMLKTDGKLLLFDVVFSFDPANYESFITGYIESMAERMGDEMEKELETHFRREFSTFGWIMEGLLEKAGFIIEKADYREGFFATYLCTKKA
ncbi:MAG: methyltransferase domain-containing protein [Sedimentisphaerales bacterium]|nr:methyltransferase domain-containing protein [Sedimentisphaerales bacterium]